MSDSIASQKGFWRLVIPDRIFLFLDISGIAFWSYAVAELFVVDFDELIASALPVDAAWMAGLTFVPMVLWLGFLAIFFRWFVVIYIAYVAIFPLIFIVWKVPALLWTLGSWNLGIATLSGMLSAFTDLPYRLISSAAYLTAISVIVISTNGTATAAGLILLVGAIVVSYGRASWNAFRTPQVFRLYRTVFETFRQPIDTDFDEEKNGPQGQWVSTMPADGIATYRDRLQMRLLITTSSYFLAQKLQDYQKSQTGVATGIASVGILLFWTFLAFSFAFLAIYKVWPEAIDFQASPSFFDFMRLSFSNLLFGDLSDAQLVGWQPIAASMLQRFLAISVVGIFLTLLFNVRTKKYDAELNETVEAMRKTGVETEQAIISYYGYANAEEAIDDLVSLKAVLAKFILRLASSVVKAPGH